MPCRDFYDDHPEAYFRDVTEPALKKQISFAESALCAALRALEHVDGLVQTVTPKTGEFYDWLNYSEAGITKKELITWHKAHKVLDKAHREKARQEKVKQDALNKLNDEEKRALGLK